MTDANARAPPAPAPAPRNRFPLQLRERIELTSKEHEVVEYLRCVCEHARAHELELRVCGGWVRDKLLGRESSDVDIALNAMTGREFAACINAYERDCGRKERVVGVMKARAEHLEVVTLPLCGVGKVDFANMRASLPYEDSARDCSLGTTFGTPLQDAERRDFTINSLFYNLSTQQVEDWTGRGLDDLRNGVIRTPMDARAMLLDDPIRAVRAVRFASQFAFALEPSLRAAIELPEVKHALATSVSRQRLGQVVATTLVGASAHAGRAVRLIRELQLLKSMLWPNAPELATVTDADGHPVTYDSDDVWLRSCAYAEQVIALEAAQCAAGGAEPRMSDPHLRKVRLLAALLLPFVGHHVVARVVSVPTYMIRDALKLSNQDARDVDIGVFRHLAAVRALVHAETFDRVRVGQLLRTIRPHWTICRDVALAQELVASGAAAGSALYEQIRARYDAFTAHVVANRLDDICTRAPLFSGGELVSALGIKPGAAVKEVLDQIFIWQLEHPEKSRDECLAHLRTTSE